MQKTYLYLMVCVIGAMSLASCSEDSISPDAGGDGDGDSTTEVPLAQVAKPKPNPWLAQEEYSITHFNSAQTDAFSSAVKDGTFNIDLSKCQMTWSGPVNLMTLASTSPNYMWGMSSDRVSYLDISDGKLERVAEAGLPGITMKTQEQLTRIIADHATYDELSKTVTDILGPVPQMSMANGNYVLCDKDNYAYTNAGQVMARYRLANPNNPKDGIMLDHQIRLTNFTFGSFTLVGATMTYDGHLVVAAQNGLLVLNRALTTIEDSYPLPSDQILTNSICIDENGGVYVASNSRTPGGKGLMQKLICKDGKISTSQADGAWQAYYDGGPQAPCIKLGHGTGSTPTLMGFGQDKDKLVVITDGSKRMKLVAFWRDEIPSDAQQVAGYDKRIAGVHEVTCGLGTSTEWIQSEQSVVVGGYDAFVVNNINVTNQEKTDKKKEPKVRPVKKKYVEKDIRQDYRKLTELLIEWNMSITTMESATAGQIASLITDTEGASAIFKGASITYSNETKIMQGVSAEVIHKYTVYSKETAEAMATACANMYGADIGIGVTGTMGNTDPDNADASVPGQVYFAISLKGTVRPYVVEIPQQPSRLMYKLAVAKEVYDVLMRLFE